MFIKYYMVNNISIIECSSNGYTLIEPYLDLTNYQVSIVNGVYIILPVNALPFNNQKGIVAKGLSYGGILIQQTCEINNILVNHKKFISFDNQILNVPSSPTSDVNTLVPTDTPESFVFLGDAYLYNIFYLIELNANNTIYRVSIADF